MAAIDAAEGRKALVALLAAGFGRNAVHLHDSARVYQDTAAIYEQRTPLQRAGATFTRAFTDEGLMSQEYLEEAKTGPPCSPCWPVSHDSPTKPGRSSQLTGRGT